MVSRLLGPSTVKPAILGLVVIVVAGLVSASPLRELLGTGNIASFRDWIGGFGLWAPAVFFVTAAGGVAAGLPRLFFAFVGGATFGVVVGGTLAQASTVLGCAINFTYGRWLGRDFVDRRLRGGLRSLRTPLEFIGRHAVAANVVVRALPVGNCFVTNLLMSVTTMSLGHFLIGTFLGTLPETVIYALFGSGVTGGGTGHWVAGGILLLLLSLGAFLMIRRSRLAGSLAGNLIAERRGEPTT